MKKLLIVAGILALCGCNTDQDTVRVADWTPQPAAHRFIFTYNPIHEGDPCTYPQWATLNDADLVSIENDGQCPERPSAVKKIRVRHDSILLGIP